ncbi:hypothetical protein K7432_015984 [Basidiobolus ranarum]|uniref:Cyclin N-terminal domain-containing protein n=1 Tax=Basidiobolus ranarum TaxID=34480 RepID=A0ABR2VMG0_9FUNG
MTCVVSKLPACHIIPESLIEFTIKRVRSVITYQETSYHRRTSSPSLTKLVKRVIRKCRIQTPTLLVALIYIDRLQKYLPVQAVGSSTTGHRIFLASLILASKFHDDASLWCADIARIVSKYWGVSEINEMERVFLNYVKFDLWVDNSELRNYMQDKHIHINIDY